MGQEIERKFLVSDDSWRGVGAARRMVQGYLSLDPERTVRVRIAGDQAWLTIKGATNGCTRVEHEFEVPVAAAEGMLALCLPGVIEKTRHEIRVGGHVWEVDEFHGANAGLVVAEIELGEEAEGFVKPEWLGEEVTEDPRYYNASLAGLPYSSFGDAI
jgi:adenylate cyclase